ncbi:unnamed protein product [Diatraea saccharalis]|uniref:Uncharacterized protein n=1 Tax=Diatraea saccharalis TaxID=40085 RepID=A0A9N9WBM3_9NEOP|nr:unnamed protein product [Diatraea saccharalis]
MNRLFHIDSPPEIVMREMLEDPSYLNMFDEDEEELEFDIINIDIDLLKVPKILTYDAMGKGLADSIMKMLDDTVKNKEATDDKHAKKDKRALATTLQDKQAIKNIPSDLKRYSGTSNAFLLELFAMHQDYDERYGFDILEAAFEMYSDRDYCILCLPSSHPPFPLLEHFTLVTPFCTRLRFINETLYVAHVNSVRGEISVRPGEASDMVYLNDILEHAPRAVSLLDLFSSSLNSQRLDSFILLSQTQPVGMVILGPLEAGFAIRTQYKLESEPKEPRTDGTHYTVRIVDDGSTTHEHSAGDGQQQHSCGRRKYNRPCICRNLVDGVGNGILRHARKYLTFTNITLVSEHGLPTVGECLKAAKTCVPQVGRYTDKYLRSVPFYYYVDFMTALMIGIDRRLCHICLDSLLLKK